MDDEPLYDTLVRFSDSQLKRVCLSAGVPLEHIAPDVAPRATRANELVQWSRQSPENRARLLEAIKPNSKPKQSPSEVPCAYLDWVWHRYARAELLGQDVRRGQTIMLGQVYVPAVTPPAPALADVPSRTRKEGEGEREPDLLIARFDRASLVVTAPAGAGKSTFCRWAAVRCHPDAQPTHAVPAPEGFEEPEPTGLRGRLPLLVPLDEFAKTIDAGNGLRTWSRSGLEAALAAWVELTAPAGLSGELLHAHLANGTALLMLDGLDEVPRSAERGDRRASPRARLLSGLEEALPVWERAGNRTLVTSRPYGLDEAELARLGLDRAPLAPLPRALQELFVHRWFHTLNRRELAEPLLAAIRERRDLDLRPLVENPLMLTAVCVLYDNGGKLPKDRHDLFRNLVNVVLHSRYPDDTSHRGKVLRRLEAVALGMHTGDPREAARRTPAFEVAWDEVERLLTKFANDNPTSEQGQVAAGDKREELLNCSGLLVPRPRQRAAFYHANVQEFLAAEAIARPGGSLNAVFSKRAPVPEWRPTLLFLFAAQIEKREPEWGVRLLQRLLNNQKPLTQRSNPNLMVFVAQALDHCIDKGDRIPDPLAARFRELALGAIEAEIDLQARQSLGLTLGRVGDPRVTDLRDPASYIEVAADTYPVGEKGRTVEITTPFRLGRFPVTNDQYRAFVEAGGYRDSRWWSDAGWEWRQAEGREEPNFWHARRWKAPNQPVVGVSFWEAEACAAWAGGRLPTADESEAAARGTAGRTYPWDGPWRDGICNTSEAGLGVTSPVGLFPSSRHPDGFDDLAGNVFEWCGDPERDVADAVRPRVVRGGSWVGGQDSARCAFRLNGPPGYRLFDVGFRVVCSSPISSADR